jgi:hypothetical protein
MPRPVIGKFAQNLGVNRLRLQAIIEQQTGDAFATDKREPTPDQQ